MTDPTTTNLAVLVAVVAAVSSLIGVIISSVFNLLNTHLSRKDETRRQLQQLAVNAAIEEWKQLIETASASSKTNNQTIYVGQLATFILKNSKIIEICSNPETNKTNIKERLVEIEETLDIAIQFINENTRKFHL